MAASSDTYHEPLEALSPGCKDMHRAVISLIEELEAIDWYQQRAEAAANDDLRAILQHNRKEEIEHAMMTLEWIRRTDPLFDATMRTYLFTEGDIVAIEEDEDAPGPSRNAPGAHDGSLGIRSLRGGK